MELSTNHAMPEHIGPFRVVRQLGQGAVGVVYLGERMDGFNQRVAMKVLHPQVSLLFGEQSIRHEEAVLTSLDHPGIVRLLDTGESAGLRCIVMEYIDGLPLDVYCRDCHLAKASRIALLLQIARALHYAHRRLVVHGDLKPANILVTRDGHPKLLDFGVAEWIGVPHTTANGTAFFTPDFASPEQCGGERPTIAADIYSLGKIGKLVLSEWQDRDLEAIFSKATEVVAADRYTSAHAFANDLEAYLEHRPIAARGLHPVYRAGRWMRRHRAATTIAIAVISVLIASSIGILVQTVRAANERTRAQKQLADVVKLNGTLAGELYDSAKPLPGAKAARATLLQTATETLDSLSETKALSSALSAEIAQQYDLLAKLERDEDGGEHGVAASNGDLEKARSLRELSGAKTTLKSHR